MDGLTPASRIAVGSLPLLDPAGAVRTQLLAFPEIPAWPQLPQKTSKEKMGLQGLCGFPGIHWVTQGQPIWNVPPAKRRELAEELIQDLKDDRLERAAFKPEEASGFYSFMNEASKPFGNKMLAVKGQVAGPLTLGTLLKDESDRPLLSSRAGMEILKTYLMMHARWQARELAKLGRPVVMFLDEPILGVSFKPENFGLDWLQVKKWISEILLDLQERDIVTGLHCCGPQPWHWIFDTPAEMVHLDSFQFMDQIPGNADKLKTFLRRGGILVWGMVPTQMTRGMFPEPAELLNRLLDLMDTLVQMGVKKDDLVNRSFFSTSCGLGNSPLATTEAAFRCLGELVSLWKATVL